MRKGSIRMMPHRIKSSAMASDEPVFETSNLSMSEFVAWGARKLDRPIVLGQGVTGTVSFTAPNLQPS